MKPQTLTQEMLLFTGTSFAKRGLCERDNNDRNQKRISIASELEKACWSGLLFDMFPDLFNENDRKTLCVRRVNQAEQFIRVELGSLSVSPEHTSIDPYFFLSLPVYHN